MHTRRIMGMAALSMLVVGLFITTGCRRQPAPERQPQNKTIVMGGVYPLSGPLSVFGQAAKEGLMAGAEYANTHVLADSPYRIAAFTEDSQGDPTVGVTAYRRLVDGKKSSVCNVILSNVSVALKTLADQDGVLLFADSTHSSLTGGLTPRHSQTAKQEAAFILKHCREQLNAESILAIVADDDYGESLIAALGKTVSSLRYDPKAADLKAIATEGAGRNADAVIVVGVGGPLGEIIRQLREQGYEGSIVATVAFDVVPSTRQVAGDAAKGVWYPRLIQDIGAMSEATSGALTAAPIAGASTIKVIAFNDVLFVAKALAAGNEQPADIRKFILAQPKIEGLGTTVVPQADGGLLPQLEMARVE